ncbi:unnamed protein product, partial [Soboliphyme baturini]|uniref:Basic proline-rich protein-like n=1 Tax=Soboliphyme baturini TaxID=241478 RepID=A0A183IAB7_9BILA
APARAAAPPSARPGPGACLPARPPRGPDACGTPASPKSGHSPIPGLPSPAAKWLPTWRRGASGRARRAQRPPAPAWRSRPPGLPSSPLLSSPLLSSPLLSSPQLCPPPLCSAPLRSALPSSPPHLAPSPPEDTGDATRQPRRGSPAPWPFLRHASPRHPPTPGPDRDTREAGSPTQTHGHPGKHRDRHRRRDLWTDGKNAEPERQTLRPADPLRPSTPTPSPQDRRGDPDRDAARDADRDTGARNTHTLTHTDPQTHPHPHPHRHTHTHTHTHGRGFGLGGGAPELPEEPPEPEDLRARCQESRSAPIPAQHPSFGAGRGGRGAVRGACLRPVWGAAGLAEPESLAVAVAVPVRQSVEPGAHGPGGPGRSAIRRPGHLSPGAGPQGQRGGGREGAGGPRSRGRREGWGLGRLPVGLGAGGSPRAALGDPGTRAQARGRGPGPREHRPAERSPSPGLEARSRLLPTPRPPPTARPPRPLPASVAAALTPVPLSLPLAPEPPATWARPASSPPRPAEARVGLVAWRWRGWVVAARPCRGPPFWGQGPALLGLRWPGLRGPGGQRREGTGVRGGGVQGLFGGSRVGQGAP